jgi:sigma-B regulation protein RsbU (phosphoserine phosphatase)
MPVRYGNRLEREGVLYQYRPDPRGEAELKFLVPSHSPEKDLLGLIAGLTVLIVLVGAGVSMWASRQVVRPVNDLIDEIRQISRGNLRSLSWVSGAREIVLLARSIDRMTRDLESAQESEMELQIREREMELAGGVRETLLPVTTPLVQGYDVGSAHISSERFGGDFHDYIELSDGRLGMLVCDVAGTGVPAALVGATARSYLRSTLLEGGDVAKAFHRVNGELVRDVRRGMFVSALYVLLDPDSATCQVACAGHKMPLVRYTAADGKLRLVHPEGIAIAFDRGPVFERALQVEAIDLEPGDRLLLSNSGPVNLESPDGQELGERNFYRMVLQHAAGETGGFLRGLKRDLEAFSGGQGFPVDVSLVTIQRESRS